VLPARYRASGLNLVVAERYYIPQSQKGNKARFHGLCCVISAGKPQS
jgi:hypothetical protein